jgi:hypothetical protein
MKSRVIPIGNGKDDEDEDEGPDKLTRDGDQMSTSARRSSGLGLTSSKKQLADDT